MTLTYIHVPTTWNEFAMKHENGIQSHRQQRYPQCGLVWLGRNVRKRRSCFKEHGVPLIGSNGRIDSDEIVGSTMVMAMVIRGRWVIVRRSAGMGRIWDFNLARHHSNRWRCPCSPTGSPFDTSRRSSNRLRCESGPSRTLPQLTFARSRRWSEDEYLNGKCALQWTNQNEARED